jgi:hypothetical protein
LGEPGKLKLAVGAGGTHETAARTPSSARFSTDDLRTDRVFQEIERLRVLGDSIPAAECQAFLDVLRNPYPEIAAPRLAWIRNDILHLLRGQSNLPKPWDEVLEDLFYHAGSPVVLRDYALQHLFRWYDELSAAAAPSTTNIPALHRMEQVFWQATEAVDSEIAGTALLGLAALQEAGRMSNHGPSELQAVALNVLESSEANPLSRLTALQVCSCLGVTNALPVATELARDPGRFALRCSAIAAMGELGGSQELAGLNAMTEEPGGSPMAAALTNAIRRLNARINSSRL